MTFRKKIVLILYKRKTKKIDHLLFLKMRNKSTVIYSVPIINLSSYTLNEAETKQLNLGLDHSFIDRNKHLKKNLAATFESLALRTSKEVSNLSLEEFHEFLRGYTDIFTKNIMGTKDYTYHTLKNLINNKDIVVLKVIKILVY